MATKDYTWNELRKHGVNYDCIITLNKREDGTLERVDHPITYLNSLFDRLERMFNDDEFYDVVDMEKAILREISIKDLNVCIPYEYHVAYINGSEDGGSNLITYNTIDQQKTQLFLDSRKANMLLSHKQRLRRKNKDLSKSEIDTLASELADKEYQVFLHEEKIKFLRPIRGTLKKYNLK